MTKRLHCRLLLSERRTCAYVACRACRHVRIVPCCTTPATRTHSTSRLFPCQNARAR